MTTTRRPFHRLIGRSAYGSDGIRIGQIRQILLDEVTGRPEWVTIATGILGARQRLAPIGDADLRQDRAVVPFPSDLVSGSPRIPPATTATARAPSPALTTAVEKMLYRHYSMTDPDPNPDPHFDIGTDTDPEAAARPALSGRQPDEADRQATSPARQPGAGVAGGPGLDPAAAGPVSALEASPPPRLGVAAIVIDPQWLADLIERVTTTTTVQTRASEATPGAAEG